MKKLTLILWVLPGLLRLLTLPLSGAEPAALLSDARQNICLNGEWKIIDTYDDEAAPPQEAWQPVRVPINWEYKDKRVSWYKKELDIPQAWQDGRRIKLYLDAVREKYAVIVNGQVCFETTIGRPFQEVDITDAVKFGASNELLIKTRRVPEHPAYTIAILNAGIVGDVFLRTMSPLNLEYNWITPSVKDMTLKADYVVRNETSTPQSGQVIGHVLDREGREVLTLPAVKFFVAPGERTTVSAVMPWSDPIFWGYGEYGEPYLYTFAGEIVPDHSAVPDIAFERFGFREFTAEGSKFYLNGKEFFIKGDCAFGRMTHWASPAASSALAYRERKAGVNFLRLTYSDNDAILDVSDELGMPVELEPGIFGIYGTYPETLSKFDEQIFDNIWEPLIRANYNHPSIIMYVPDNESFSVGTVSPAAMSKLRGRLDKAKQLDQLCTQIRQLDSSRILDSHHNYMLYTLLESGVMTRDNFQVFNIHPYGELESRINTESAGVGFQHEVPIIVGEVFAHPNQWYFNLDLNAVYADQFRCAQDFREKIPAAARAQGVSGMLICTLDELAGVGYQSPDKIELGPWSESAVNTTNPEEIRDIQHFWVKAHWPSLSGPGVKTEVIRGVNWNIYRTGENINWFDPNAPIFRSNVIYEAIKDAYQALKEPVPAFAERYPEVLVCTSAPNTYVTLRSADHPGAIQGVLSDANGTAWFRVTALGEYIAEYLRDNQTLEQTRFTIKENPRYTDRAGYDYLTWVDLGPGAKEVRETIQHTLAQPVEKVQQLTLKQGEMVWNGDFKVANLLTGAPHEWEGGGTIDTTNDLLLVGKGEEVWQKVGPFSANEVYLLNFEFRKELPGETELLTVGNLSFSGNSTANEWQQVTARIVFDHAEAGPRLTLLGRNGAVAFRNISITKAEDPEIAAPVKDKVGPFAVDENGFLYNFLIVGPFPHGSEAERNQDFLESIGGTATARPVFGDEVPVEFKADNYWKPGKGVNSWRQLNSPTSYIDLPGLMRVRKYALTMPEPPYLCAYLYTVIDSPTKREAKLKIGSDDGYRLFLNNTFIGEKAMDRGAEADQESYHVTLESGRNYVMIRLYQVIGGWGLYLRFTDPEDHPLTDLQIYTE